MSSECYDESCNEHFGGWAEGFFNENGVFHQNWGLVEGRHEIPNVDGYIFGTIEDVLDFTKLQMMADSWVDVLWDWFTVDGDTNTLNPFFDTDDSADWSINIYVTGLTSALIALIGAFAHWRLTGITFWHYNRDTGEYVPQSWSF